MKLSQIRPCDNCGGPIAPIFQVIRTSVALFNPQAANQMLGMTQMFGGTRTGLAIAEVMGPNPEVVKIAMDEKEFAGLKTEIFLCQKCFIADVNIAMLSEKVCEATSRTVDEAV